MALPLRQLHIGLVVRQAVTAGHPVVGVGSLGAPRAAASQWLRRFGREKV